MSFVHDSTVAHFDPSDLESIWSRPAPVPTRAIDPGRVQKLLSFYGVEVARCVETRDGYVRCEWSSDRSRRTYEFADRLADQEAAIILESPGYVRYPPEAVRRFEAALRARQEGWDDI